ncbi:hypothetical protein HaLaN_00778 [Haematococcus lacustris]|uniref:Uncharacterized protein n=1 Tax=Haematococcus lacustris TaxID=44745 RepID=A0A699YEC3_HAELA|nr:hypothetical protein HaLaN_00778 [Haematococcus lacustris]
MSPEAERLLSCLTLVLTAMMPQELCLALAGGVTDGVPKLGMTLEEENMTMSTALSKLQPEQVWTWQALAAGTPAEATLRGLLSALASLFQVQGLVTPIAPGWRHQRLTLALDDYVRRLEAACQLLHEGPQATGAQPASSCPAAHKVSPAASTTPSAGSSTSAVELCTLLLTDKEVLDVVLALHDVRSAQLCHLMLWPGSHALKLPPPSQALAKQLSQSQRSVPGSQLLSFVRALDSNNSLEHPDPAATTHTSTKPQLPPGYMHCSACLLLSLRLAICLAQHCAEQPLDKDLALARLHATLPRLLLGLSTAVTVMQAAGHPEAQAQRVQFLAPLALDLVLGMENTLQMVIQQQDMVWKWPFWNDGNLVQGIADGYRTLLALFGHVIEVLATPSVVGPAGLAAQPASWLPCGNSLVEGWCTRLLAGVCKLMCIATPASAAVPVLFKIMLNRRLQGSYRLLLRGQRQAPPSMSPEAERLLSCLTLVLTAMLPQDLCLAMARGVTDPVPTLDMTLEKECMAMGVPLSKLQPEQVWTWQALAAGTPAKLTLQGLLHAMASFFEVQGLVTPIAPGWRHQRLTLAMGEWDMS